MRLISFGETVGDVEVEALLNTLHHSLAEVETKPLVSGVTLTEMLAKNRGETLNNLPGEWKAEALLDALAGTLGHIKANIFFYFIVGNVDTKAFINTMHQN